MLGTKWRLLLVLALLAAGCGTSTRPVPRTTTSKKGSTPAGVTAAISKWQVVLKSDQFAYLSLACPTKDRCIAGGYGPLSNYEPVPNPANMPTPEFGAISSTQDGGSRWVTTRLPRPVAAVACMTKVRCIAVEQGNLYNASSGWSTWVTTDGGNTWAKEPDPGPGGVTSLSCPSAIHCVAVGTVDVHAVGQVPATLASASWVSNDAGISWVRSSEQASGPVSCPSPLWCMAAGGGAISRDGGATWQTVQSSGMSAYVVLTISCVAADECTAGGFRDVPAATGDSIWLTTSNGGLSWQEHVIDDPSADQISSLDCPRVGICVALIGMTAKGQHTTSGKPLRPSAADELVYIQGHTVHLARISTSLYIDGGYVLQGPGISCPAYPRCYAEMPGGSSTAAGGVIADWYILRSG